MPGSLLRAARFIYRRTPVRALRIAYFQAFAWMVRHRRVQRRIDGADFALDLGEMIDLTLLLGEFENDVRAAIGRLCRPGMNVIDIGANIGAHTFLLARQVMPGGCVIAFEPTGYAFAKLSRNVSLNPGLNVTAVHAALAEAEGEAREVEFRSSWPVFGPRRDGKSIVGFQTLDGWIERNAVDRVDMMKLDVDGNEYGVLKGAEGVLARFHPAIIMEVVGPHLDDEARNPLRILERHGYAFRDVRTGQATTIGQMREVLPRNDIRMSTSMNIIAEVLR